MARKLMTLLVLASIASPAVAQTGPGYGSQWSGPFSGWMPWQGYPSAPMMGWNQGLGMGQMGDWSGFGMMQGWSNPNVPGRGRFAMIDANEDGSVSGEEAASQADMIFTAMDADDDGSLSFEEYMSVREGSGFGFNPNREAIMQARKSSRFDPMDANQDGAVTKAEFIAASKAHFDASDADGDGNVTPWEMRSSNWN